MFSVPQTPENDLYLNLIIFVYVYVHAFKLNIAFSKDHLELPPGQIFTVSDFSLWFRWSLYKSVNFLLSASSRGGLAFLDKHKHSHLSLLI
jgi:hypothetical protein